MTFKIENSTTETIIISNIENLDPVTVYIKNYSKGLGKITIECYGKSWSNLWPAMGDRNIQEFFIDCDNDYLLKNLIEDTTKTDFDEINRLADMMGVDINVESDVEVAFCSSEMTEILGTEWLMDIPKCKSDEYNYLSKIIDTIKEALLLQLSVYKS